MTSENTASPQLRAACYCRISSDPDDKKEGVDRQREDTAMLCELKGWTIVDVYVDNDRSASNGKRREEWERLLADVEAGKIDAVAAWDQDRVNRTMDDLQTYASLFIARGIKLATTNSGDIDLASPQGMMIAQIKTAVSQHEVAMLKLRQKRAARQKAEQGVPKWTHAFGYRRAGDVFELDDETAPLVVEAYAAILTGCALSDIARLFNNAGKMGLNGKPWVPSTVSLFLRAARNAGLRSHNGEIVGKGQWPAIVDENTWRSAQLILNDDRRKPGRKSVKQHLLTGVLKCGKCGHHLSGGSRQKDQRVYSCVKCRGVSIRAGAVEPLLYKIVAGRLAMADANDLLKREIHDGAEAEQIRLQLATFYARQHEIGIERAKGWLTGEQAHDANEYLNDQIAELQRKQQDDERLRVFEGIPIGRPEVREAIEELPAGRYRAVLDVLMTITIKPVGKGGYQVIDPRTGRKGIKEDRVKVDWR